MTGLKSGSGDDLWGDDGEDADDTDAETVDDEIEAAEADSTAADDEQPTDLASVTEQPPETTQTTGPSERGPSESTNGEDEPAAQPDLSSTGPPTSDADESGGAIDLSAIETATSDESQSYIVRRAVQDKSVQFERDERLTFFVHDDVADGERDLITQLQSVLGRDVPKFDVREAVYRAALRNPDDVLEELLEMGYSVDEE